MNESADVRNAFERFADRLSANDVASFDDLVSSDPATVVIGTAPGERVTDRAALRFGFETEGVRLELANPVAYAEESTGWVVDEPLFYFPDGTAMKTRLTAVLHLEDERWKLIHMHLSVGVPDDEVVELQKKWTT
jgi:SnoaL-like protein